MEMKWISVNQSLPFIPSDTYDVSDSVLICYHRKCLHCFGIDSDNKKVGENISIGYYSNIDEKNDWNLCEPLSIDFLPNDQSDQIVVIHWMPLPEPPDSIID